MYDCKNTYKEYVKCMKKNNSTSKESVYKKYTYCSSEYRNFIKCLNSFKDVNSNSK